MKALLRRGAALRLEHRKEEALAAYEQAFALAPTPAIRAQRALAEQALARWLKAEADLDIALGSDDAWVERNRSALEGARSVVRAHLAWLRVKVDANAEPSIALDGEPLIPGAEARVVAGESILEVKAPGYAADARRVVLAPRAHVTQEVALERLASIGSPTTPADPATLAPPSASLVSSSKDDGEHRSKVRPLPILLGAIGIAGIATGAYFGVRTFQDKSDETAHCVGGCTSIAGSDYRDAQTSAAVSTIAIGAGAAFLIGGGVLWVLQERSAKRAAAERKVVPVVGPGMSGLAFVGTF